MFTLYRHTDIEWQLTPEDYPLVLSPDRAMEQVKKHYDLDPRRYNHFGFFELPERLFSRLQTWRRAQSGYADQVYDTVKESLRIGWLIGINSMEEWHSLNNPFCVDEKGNLVCESPGWYDEWYLRQIIDGYNTAVARRNGVKASPTQRIHYGHSCAEPEQYAQAARAINSKAAGRLLAAGGIYNGNIEAYGKTAQQLGGDAPAGYDQVMNKKTLGIAVAGASLVAGAVLGRLGPGGEISQLNKLAGVKTLASESNFITNTGTLVNADKSVIDLKKLTTYALNPDHPAGGSKARVFESALGFNSSNADVLSNKLRQGVILTPAVLGNLDKFGQRAAVTMPIIGINGNSAWVRTGWIYDPGSSVPRLVTAYVIK